MNWRTAHKRRRRIAAHAARRARSVDITVFLAGVAKFQSALGMVSESLVTLKWDELAARRTQRP